MSHTNRYVEVDHSEFSKTDITVERGNKVRYYKTNPTRRRRMWAVTRNMFGSGVRLPAMSQRQNVVKKSINLMFDVAERMHS